MSRAHPIGLRIASKKLNVPFIGASQYYFYNQLKQNIVVNKNTRLLNKQLVIPVNRITKHLGSKKRNTKGSEILYPSILPISIILRAKQLFDSQYALNRRRLFSTAIYYAKLLQQRFEKSQDRFTFTENYPSDRSYERKHSSYKHKQLSLRVVIKKQKKSKSPFLSLFNPIHVLSPQSGLEAKKGKQFKKRQEKKKDTTSQLVLKDPNIYCILPHLVKKTNQMFELRRFVGLIKKASTSYHLLANFVNSTGSGYNVGKGAINHRNKDYYWPSSNSGLTCGIKNRSGLPLIIEQPLIVIAFALAKTRGKPYSPNISAFCTSEWPSFIQSILLLRQKKEKNIPKNQTRSTLTDLEIRKNKKLFHDKLSKMSPYLAAFTSTLQFLKENLYQSVIVKGKKGDIKAINQQQQLYDKPSKRGAKGTILLAFMAQLCPINRALYQFSVLQKKYQPTTAINLAKEVHSRQKRLYINSVPVSKANIFTNLHAHSTTHTICARSNLAILNPKNTSKKLTKQMEHFRNGVKLFMPLGLLIHRSFLEPAGIHYVSALENRLAKTNYSPFFKNCLFTKVPTNYLRSNYMRTQAGLVRLKDAIMFEFAYTKHSLIKLNLKKTNALMQQLLETGHTKLWLRKTSSIRL